MSIDNKQTTWLSYAVTILLGLGFTIVLLLATWNNAIDSKSREFELASSSIKGTLTRNVQTANDALNSLSSFLEVSPGLSFEQYSTITSSLLGLHPFMESAVYVTKSADNPETDRPYSIRYQNVRSGDTELPQQELLSDNAYANIINNLFESKSVTTMASEYSSNGWRSYWILRSINLPPYHSSLQNNFGFVAILINTNKLAGISVDDTDLSIMLLSDSSSLSGRLLLFQNAEAEKSSWMTTDFIEEGITQFPYYSVRLSMTKMLSWSELDKTMLYISLLIGAGVTLLLVALAKSKDDQERELRDRNVVIEAKVNAQTEELANARDEAMAASLMKSSFLASMSHEIRTPLNAIIGMSDLLSETKLDFEQMKYVSVFKKAGDTLLSLVNDILDLSKIEANQLILEEMDFNLIDTVEESVEIYALLAAEKSIELICDIDPAIQPIRRGDPSRLRQVLLNLISNALKFTDEGEIVVSVKLMSDRDANLLEIAVSDTGIGISRNKLEKIFESFSQADASTTRKYGGTGLGLTISKRLVEMMFGRLWVKSEVDVGSQFILDVSLPVVDGHKDNTIKATIPNDNLDVLVVDDNQNYRDLLVSYLKAVNINPSSTNNADQAIEFLKRTENINNVRVVLVDAEMPEVDGFSLVKRMRNDGYSVPVIMMLNPATLKSNQMHLEELGIQQMYLTKPIRMKELYKIVDVVLHGTKDILGENISENTISEQKPLRILLVDDNPDNRLLVNAYLKKLPYTVEEAENGEEAVNLYKQVDFDLVLMDVQMPILDGREATRRIREWEKQENRAATPIIALTAHAIKEEIDMCIDAGCDTHLSKPVKKQTLIDTINKLMETDN